MKTGIYAHALNEPAENFIGLMRKLNPQTLNAVIGICYGYRVDITIPENKWDGEAARQIWLVKHAQTVSDYIKDLSDYYPVNRPMIGHIAQQCFIDRNKINAYSIADHIYFTYWQEMRRQLFTSDASFEQVGEDCKIVDTFDYQLSMLFCHLCDGFAKYDGFVSENIDEQRLAMSVKAEEAISAALANKDITAAIDIENCRSFMRQVIDATISLVITSVPFTDMAINYLVNKELPNRLPANAVELTDEEKIVANELFKGARGWKI